MPPETVTPYSTAKPFMAALMNWVPEFDQERLAAYDVYEDMYWNVPDAFKLSQRGQESKPLYIPKPMTIVDTTSHYFLKGLQLTIEQGQGHEEAIKEFNRFLMRERFYSRFHTAKHSGVSRGDFIMHITADPTKEPGKRISLTSVDPRQFFPVYSDDDLEKLEAVHLIEQFYDNDHQKILLKKLTYRYVGEKGTRRVSRTEGIFELEDWFDEAKQEEIQTLMSEELLPPQVVRIPVYHFKNKEWQGDEYGSSELRGLERVIAGINQSMSDEEITLALDGLGVYHTDAPPPTDDNGDEEDWEIFPGKVLETPTGSIFKRVEGVGSVKPFQDHVGFLEASLHEASGTSDVAIGKIDVATAQSGIALAIKFMPTLAKIEERDQAGVEGLANLFYDWRTMWVPAYEQFLFPDLEIIPVLGDKLPTDRVAKFTELNNMKDRSVISRAYYRAEAEKLGYEFPATIEEEILAEAQALAEAMMAPAAAAGTGDSSSTLPDKNQSNNKGRSNESAGTEQQQSQQQQEDPNRGQ